jgi:hypothetical protein
MAGKSPVCAGDMQACTHCNHHTTMGAYSGACSACEVPERFDVVLGFPGKLNGGLHVRCKFAKERLSKSCQKKSIRSASA